MDTPDVLRMRGAIESLFGGEELATADSIVQAAMSEVERLPVCDGPGAEVMTEDAALNVYRSVIMGSTLMAPPRHTATVGL